jgi:hypothetical protein
MGISMYAFIISSAKFLVFFAIWLSFLIAFIAYTKTAVGRFWPQFVQVGTFADINDGSRDLSPVLVSRAAELSRPVSLDALFEVKVPPITRNFGAKDDLKFLDDVKLSLQGVDVPSIIRAALNALPDDHYTITAKPGTAGAAGPVLNMEFTSPSGDRKSWLLRAETPPSGVAAPSAAATTSQVVDRAIYTIWYYMYYDPKGLKWRKDLEANFTSARTLEAYYGGQQRLASYQRTFQAGDLDDAEKEFRLLISEMPQFVSGWMFLGIASLEQRSERDAIRAFDRAQQLLTPAGGLPATATDRQTALQARLFTANALLQMYDWQDSHQALRILEAMRSDIPSAPEPNMTRQAFYDLSKIRFSVLFQTANVVGHDLILLNEDNFVDALTEPPGTGAATGAPSVPASVRPVDERQKLLRDHDSAARNTTDPAQLATAKAQRRTDFTDEMTRIFGKQQALVTEAENALKAIGTLVNDNTVPTAEQLNKEEWERQRERLTSDLRNADGYAQFRYAQRHEADDGQFKKLCKDALAKLIEAQAARPNEYTVLQNLGLIYGDPRYDPDGKELDTAKALFERSLQIKERDYYGHQKLATLAIRQAYERGVEFFGTDAINAAITHAERARELRPGGGTILALLAQLYTIKWSKGSDQQGTAPLIEASLALAEKGDRASPLHVRTAQLQWQLARLRASTGGDFDKAKTALLATLQLAQTDTTGNANWEARDLLARTTSLSAKLQNLGSDDRTTARWSN